MGRQGFTCQSKNVVTSQVKSINLDDEGNFCGKSA